MPHTTTNADYTAPNEAHSQQRPRAQQREFVMTETDKITNESHIATLLRTFADLHARREGCGVLIPAVKMPSGAPAWLFPVLAAAVLIVGIGAWAGTRTPSTPAPPALVKPIVEATGDVAEDDGEEAAEDEAEAPAGAAGGKRGARGNKVGDWAIRPPKAAAESATLDGDTLILSASADAVRSACKGPIELTGPVTVEAEWKLDGIAGGVAKLVARQADANGKVIRGPTGRSMVARGKGTGQWKAVTAEVTPADGAAKLFVCLELDKGAGSASIRGVRP